MWLTQKFAQQEGDTAEIKLRKTLALLVSLACSICGVLWAILYYQVFGITFTTFLPIVFVLIVGPAAIIAHIFKKVRILAYAQILCIMLVTHGIQWSIGSLDQSGLVLAWSFLGPAGAVIFLDRGKALVFMALWLVLLVISTFLEPNLFGNSYDLPQATKSLFYTINLGISFSVLFSALIYFHLEKERGLSLLLTNQKLERTNYEQELLLRQSEKLATLGRLSAGIAHELNNPAAAVQRGAIRLQQAIPNLNNAQFQLGTIALSMEELKEAQSFIDNYAQQNAYDQKLDPLEINDLELAMESILNDMGIDRAWEIAPELISMGVDQASLKSKSEQFGIEKMQVLLSVLYNLHATNNFLDEISQGTTRISEIVKALKAYTYMDQSPQQFIQLNEGLNNTLIMLRSKLKLGITIHKNLQENLPEINGFGSELNQVWTNLIDNAIDAMDGVGDIYLKTWCDEENVFLEVKDTGKGMSEKVKKHIFDPFYTTKEQGKGTGLGLHISYNIIKKHKGNISVESKPGETIFQVKLPIRFLEKTN